jgi:hypothetical protein
LCEKSKKLICDFHVVLPAFENYSGLFFCHKSRPLFIA